MAKQTFDQKFKKQVRSFEISLSSAVQRTTASLKEIVGKLALSGMSTKNIQKVLEKDLVEGGRVFGEFRRAVKATSEGLIGKVSTDAYLEEFGADIEFTWIAALVNTCDDCMPRHGEVKSFEEWEAEGLPRSGWSVCKEHCQCVLIPEKIAAERNELREPLDRKKAMAERAEARKK